MRIATAATRYTVAQPIFSTPLKCRDVTLFSKYYRFFRQRVAGSWRRLWDWIVFSKDNRQSLECHYYSNGKFRFSTMECIDRRPSYLFFFIWIPWLSWKTIQKTELREYERHSVCVRVCVKSYYGDVAENHRNVNFIFMSLTRTISSESFPSHIPIN